MAYGYPEFPSGSFYDNDLSEMLYYYKRLVQEYDEFIRRLKFLEEELDKLNNHIDEVLDAKVADLLAEMERLRISIEAQMSELEQKVNTAVQEIKGLSKLVESEIRDIRIYVNTQVSNMESYVDNSVADLQSKVSQQIRDLQAKVDAQLAQLNIELRRYIEIELRKFDETLADLNKKIVDMKSYVDVQNTRLKAELYRAIDDLEEKIVNITVDQVWVKSPIDGKILNIQEMIDQLWDSLDWWSLTTLEYDALNLAAEEYDNWDTLMLSRATAGYKCKVWDKWNADCDIRDDIGISAAEHDYWAHLIKNGRGLTAEEYDFLGKWYLMEKGGIVEYVKTSREIVLDLCRKCKKQVEGEIAKIKADIEERTTMFSPFTGRQDKVKNIVAKIFDFITFGALTAQEYDDLDLTAQEYDDKDITAYDYDWYGIRSLMPSQFNGITAEQYDGLGVLADGHVIYRLS